MYGLTGVGSMPCSVVLCDATRRPCRYFSIDGCETTGNHEAVGPTQVLTACCDRGDGRGVAVLIADLGRKAGRWRLFQPESSTS
jgi:hypothetical protein